MIGAASDGAGEDGERVGEGHGRRDAHADGVAGAAVDAEDDAADARALALLHVPYLPGRVPLHPSHLSQPRTHNERTFSPYQLQACNSIGGKGNKFQELQLLLAFLRRDVTDSTGKHAELWYKTPDRSYRALLGIFTGILYAASCEFWIIFPGDTGYLQLAACCRLHVILGKNGH